MKLSTNKSVYLVTEVCPAGFGNLRDEIMVNVAFESFRKANAYYKSLIKNIDKTIKTNYDGTCVNGGGDIACGGRWAHMTYWFTTKDTRKKLHKYYIEIKAVEFFKK